MLSLTAKLFFPSFPHVGSLAGWLFPRGYLLLLLFHFMFVSLTQALAPLNALVPFSPQSVQKAFFFFSLLFYVRLHYVLLWHQWRL